jgi:hypothetical protein
MSEAIELFHKDGRPAGIFYCSECRIVHKTESEAQQCHSVKLCACGQPVTRYFTNCEKCRLKGWRDETDRKELARFEKAKKITPEEYDGAHVFCGEKYYDSVEEAIDDYLEGQEPEYVWACKDINLPKADIDRIIEPLVEEMWEDADSFDLNGIDELEKALAAFDKANEGISLWNPDYSTAILIKQEEQ